MTAALRTAARRSEEATAPRGTAALLLLGLLAVLAGQLLLLPQLLAPEQPGSLFDISSSKRLLGANAALLALTAVAALTLGDRRRWLALVPVSGIAGLTLVGATVLGGRAWPAAVAALTLLACWSLGGLVTRRLATQALQGIVVVDVVLGAAIIGIVTLLLGRIDGIAWWTVGLVVVLAGAHGMVRALGAARPRASGLVTFAAGSPLRAMTAATILLQLAWSIVYVSAPDVMFDALYGKAFLPELWAESGSIGPLIQSPALNLAGLAQILATPGHALGADDVGRWLQIGAWLLTLATVWWWSGGRDSLTGPLAAGLLAVTPHLLWQNSTAYDDNVLMLPAAALTIAIFRSLSDRERTATLGDALLIGALAGTAVWFKLHLLVLAAVMTAGWLLLSLRGAGAGAVRRTAALIAGGVLAAGPALLIRWIDTGNPVFPNYNAIFKSKYAPLENGTLNFPFWPEATLQDLLRLPYEAVAHPSLMTEAVPPGAFGFLVVALVGAVLLGWRGRDRPATLIVWLAVLVSAAAWWVQLRYLRYTLPMATASVLLLGHQLRGLRPTRGTTILATVLVAASAAAFLPSSLASFWNVPERKPPFGAAFGRWDHENYLRTVFAEKDALDAYRRLAPAGALAISGAHERTFTQDRQLSPVWEVGTRMTLLGPLPSDAGTALRRLRQVGVDWAVLQSNGTTLQEFPWLRAAIDRYGEAVYADRGWTVYRFVDAPPRPVGSERCDDTRRAGTRTCWTGTLDRQPGIGPGDSISRVVRACPGTTISVGVTVGPAGAAVPVTIDADGTTGLYGSTQGLALPGGTTEVYATIPQGSRAATIYLAPTAGMATVRRITTGVLGAC